MRKYQDLTMEQIETELDKAVDARPLHVFWTKEKTKIVADDNVLNLRVLDLTDNPNDQCLWYRALPYCKRMHINEPFYESSGQKLDQFKDLINCNQYVVKMLSDIYLRYKTVEGVSLDSIVRDNPVLIDQVSRAINDYVNKSF
jgi:hypothetical protein